MSAKEAVAELEAAAKGASEKAQPLWTDGYLLLSLVSGM